jgi:hypothetical protein
MASGYEFEVQLVEQQGQLFAEELMSFAQTAALVEWREFQILRLDADGRGDVVADEIQPRELLGAEIHTCLGLIHEPFVEAFGHGVGEGREHGLLFQREADEGDEVGKNGRPDSF